MRGRYGTRGPKRSDIVLYGCVLMERSVESRVGAVQTEGEQRQER